MCNPVNLPEDITGFAFGDPEDRWNILIEEGSRLQTFFPDFDEVISSITWPEFLPTPRTGCLSLAAFTISKDFWPQRDAMGPAWLLQAVLEG